MGVIDFGDSLRDDWGLFGFGGDVVRGRSRWWGNGNGIGHRRAFRAGSYKKEGDRRVAVAFQKFRSLVSTDQVSLATC